MARYTLRVPGNVTASTDSPTGYSHPSFVVGDAPQWNDGSDDTYAELETFEHPDVSYNGVGYGDLENRTIRGSAARVTATAHIRYQSMSVDMAPPQAWIYNGAQYRLSGPTLPPPGSSAPTWVEIPLTSGDMGLFLLDLNAGATMTLQVRAPFLNTYSYRTPHTRIFEAYVVIDTGPTDAPPCRIFPRSDGLGVGSGRAFPPPRSQQRSPGNRGVGYY